MSDDKISLDKRKIDKTLLQLQNLQSQVKTPSAGKRLSFLFEATQQSKLANVLDIAIRTLKNYQTAQNITQILTVLTSTALYIHTHIRARREAQPDIYTQCIQICDQSAADIMRTFQDESHLDQLPRNIQALMYRAITEPGAAMALMATTKVLSLLSPTPPQLTAIYDYRSTDLKQSRVALPISPSKPTIGKTTTQLIALADHTLFFPMTHQHDLPQWYVYHTNNTSNVLLHIEAVALHTEHFLFLANHTLHQVSGIELTGDHYHQFSIVPYPSEKLNQHIRQLFPISHQHLIVIFDDNACYLLDLQNRDHPWHHFFTAEAAPQRLQTYGLHTQPILLMRFGECYRLFDIKSLLEKQQTRYNELSSELHLVAAEALSEGLLATAQKQNDKITLWTYQEYDLKPKLRESLSIDNFLGYAAHYHPTKLCHMSDDNLAILFESNEHKNQVIIIIDPIHDHFIGQISQSIISNIHKMLALPNGDLLIAGLANNKSVLMTWSTTKRHNIIFESDVAIRDVTLLLPDQIGVQTENGAINLLRFPTVAESQHLKRQGEPLSPWSRWLPF